MSSTGTIPLKEIWALLDECAAGYTTKQGQHNWLVMYDGKTFRGLPLGPHGKRTNPSIELGYLRQLVRFFEIEECAQRQTERLR